MFRWWELPTSSNRKYLECGVPALPRHAPLHCLAVLLGSTPDHPRVVLLIAVRSELPGLVVLPGVDPMAAMILTVVPRFAALTSASRTPQSLKDQVVMKILPRWTSPSTTYLPQVALIVFTTRLRMAVLSEEVLFG